MSRRTREEKIIADLRRQLKLRQEVTKEVTRPAKLSVAPVVKLPVVKVKETNPIEEATDYGYLKRELLKVGVVVSFTLAIELISSFLVSSGALRSWGIM